MLDILSHLYLHRLRVQIIYLTQIPSFRRYLSHYWDNNNLHQGSALTPRIVYFVQHLVDEIASGGKNYMVLCGARHEDELLRISAELQYHNVKHHMFYEPDVDSYTAIATVPPRGAERVPLRKYKTM